MRNQKGFTVIELVIVIASIFILSVIVFTSLSSLNTGKLRSAGYRLMSDVVYARELAVNRHLECGVMLDPASDSYYVYIGNLITYAIDPYSKNILAVDYTSDQDFQGMDLVSTTFGNRIRFDLRGAPLDSSGTSLSSVGIINVEYNGSTVQVFIEPETGKVALQ